VIFRCVMNENRRGGSKMKTRIKRITHMLSLAVIIGAFVGLSGCASTGATDSLQTQIDAMKVSVSEARSDAAAATARANEAVTIADEANRRSVETEIKIDRMFKKAMHK